MFLPSFCFLLLVTLQCALALRGQSSDLNKAPGTPTRPRTNAQRFAAGMAPAAPRALARYVRTRAGSQRMRVPGRRQDPSAVPVPNDGFITLISNSDDSSGSIALPFSVQIFSVTGTELQINTDGAVFLNDINTGTSGIVRPFSKLGQSGEPSLEVKADFTDDNLDSTIRPNDPATASGWGVYVKSDANSLAIRWRMYTSPSPADGTQDFTMTYTTTQPGVWTTSYGAYTGAGDGQAALVDAEARGTMPRVISFSQDTAFRTPDDNLVVVLDTVAGTVKSTSN